MKTAATTKESIIPRVRTTATTKGISSFVTILTYIIGF